MSVHIKPSLSCIFWNEVLQVTLSLPVATLKVMFTPRVYAASFYSSAYLEEESHSPSLTLQKYRKMIQTSSCHQGEQRGTCNPRRS